MFKVGDIVKHKASFLRSIGWYFDVPINGKVISLNKNNWPKVFWNTEEELSDEDGTLINPVNIMMAKDPDYSGM